MSTITFQKATKKRSKARIALDGPSGAGKTYTALIAATVMAEGGRIAVIDTERGSASLYSDRFDFNVLELANFNPQHYIDAIEAAEQQGFSVIVIDSLTHAWEGEGGALDLVDKAAKRSQSGNSYTAWKDVTPLQRRLVDTMLQSRCHIVATMRSKMDYVQEKDERTGKTVIRKVGMAPIQRQGMEYEFTIVGDMDIDHNLAITKSRCEALADAVVNKPDSKFFQKLLDWLNAGVDVPQTPTTPQPSPAGNNGHVPEPRPEQKQPAPAASSSSASSPNSVGIGGGQEGVRTPDQVKAFIEATSAQWVEKKISDGKKGVIAPNLEACFAAGDASAKRHQVQLFLTGKASIRDIPDNYLIAMYMWLSPTQDSGGAWSPSAQASREANAIIAALDAQPGQMTLPSPSSSSPISEGIGGGQEGASDWRSILDDPAPAAKS